MPSFLLWTFVSGRVAYKIKISNTQSSYISNVAAIFLCKFFSFVYFIAFNKSADRNWKYGPVNIYYLSKIIATHFLLFFFFVQNYTCKRAKVKFLWFCTNFSFGVPFSDFYIQLLFESLVRDAQFYGFITLFSWNGYASTRVKYIFFKIILLKKSSEFRKQL